MSGYYNKINKEKNYLYSIYYSNIDYSYAFDYFAKQADPVNIGGCSAIKNGNIYGRNLDWVYDNTAEFIVYTPEACGRYSVVGIAGGISELTNDFVESGKYNKLYKLVPFALYDGMNSCGVVANMNVVPTDKGINKVVPSYEPLIEISSSMLVRYILDNFATAEEAVEFIQKYATIYFPKSLHDKNYELHFMVADKDKCFIMEFVNNSTVIIEHNYITNFHIDNVTFNSDGKVYTPYTQTETENAYDTNGVTLNGSGLERYNIIVDNYNNSDTKDGMRQLLDKLIYTKSYTEKETEDMWFTEFVGNGITVKSSIEDYKPVVDIAIQNYKDRDRDFPTSWQTVHSVIYDLENNKIYLKVQESNEELTYNLEGDKMYKIFIKPKCKDYYVPYSEKIDGDIVEWFTTDLLELEFKYRELLNKYDAEDIKAIQEMEVEIDVDIIDPQ